MGLAVSRAGTAPGEESHALAGPPLAHGDALRLNLRPRAHALQAIDYDGLAGGESRLHHPQAVDDRTELHRPVLGLVARAYDQDEIGRASCRERGKTWVGAGRLNKKQTDG